MTPLSELGNHLRNNYFRFGRPKPADRAAAMAGAGDPPPPQYALLGIGWQYVAVLVGIFLQPIIAQLRKGGPSGITFDFASLGYLVASAAVTMVIFPGVYRPKPPATHPRFVQFCLLFGAGIGWQTILGTIVK